MSDLSVRSRSNGSAERPKTSQDILFGMEDDVRSTKDLANAIIIMAAGYRIAALNEDDGEGALLRVALILSDRAASVVNGWEKAFEAKGDREGGHHDAKSFRAKR